MLKAISDDGDATEVTITAYAYQLISETNPSTSGDSSGKTGNGFDCRDRMSFRFMRPEIDKGPEPSFV